MTLHRGSLLDARQVSKLGAWYRQTTRERSVSHVSTWESRDHFCVALKDEANICYLAGKSYVASGGKGDGRWGGSVSGSH